MQVEKALKVIFTKANVEEIIRQYVIKNQPLSEKESEHVDVYFNISTYLQIEGDEMVTVGKLDRVTVIVDQE